MPNRKKEKGDRVERELVKLAQKYGFESRRAYGSDGRSLGLNSEVDLLVGEYRVQSKSRKKMPKWLFTAIDGVDFGILRFNNKKPLAVVDYEWLLQLIKKPPEGG